MSIKGRITLLYTLLTAGILMLFIAVVYVSAYGNRLNEFYEILEKEALTKVNLLLETQLDAETLQTIYRNNREILYEVEVAIYDQNLQLIYHDAVEIDFVKETPEMLREIMAEDKIRFVQAIWQVVGLRVSYNGQNYLVTAAAYDVSGFRKLENLRNTSLVTFIFGLIFIFLVGRYFSKKALEPVAEMIQEAQEISASKLDLRLKEANPKDELGQLAITFNQMLERLEKSFDGQKQFVSNVSHELRTPLTAIVSQLELAKNKEMTLENYQQSIQQVLSDATKMARLTGALLDFAKASYDRSEVNFKPVRVDEVLLDASQQMQLKNPDWKIDLDFEGDFEEEQITISGNNYLLMIAFSNLMENGCKYSPDHYCSVTIGVTPGITRVSFTDKGTGIDPAEQELIFSPFYRGANKNLSEGSGIGLALVAKIVALHEASLSLQSTPGIGSTFAIEFKRS